MKRFWVTCYMLRAFVAPRAGAWIETALMYKVAAEQGGRPPRGGVD